MTGLPSLELVLNGLKVITFPVLVRPPNKPSDAPTEDLLQWCICVYVYSAIAQLRRILEAMVLVAKAKNIPASYVLARHVFEWTAHACYMSRNLKTYSGKKDWNRAWSLLSAAAIGNLWLKLHGGKYSKPGTQPPPPVPDPLSIANAVACYGEYLRQTHGVVGSAKDTCGLLSETSHPNAACLQQHQVLRAGGRETEITDAEPISPLPFVNWALLDFLLFADDLLELAKEKTIRPQIGSILDEIKKRAPAKRT